jgi:hypothetical protein
MHSAEMIDDITHRFTNHPPENPAVSEALDSTTRWMIELGEFILRTVPPGRERALALTNLEQTSMWMKAGIARNQDAFVEEPTE